MRIAVITGASSGIGREFVLELDREEKFDELWLIARRKDRLEALQTAVRAKVRAISLDLSDMQSIEEYARLLAEVNPQVLALVNGSGFGKFKQFTDAPLEDYYSMIDLNSKAVVGMVYKTLPYMQRGSIIYNVDSMSAFQPVPYINIYGATKAFVLSFSRALNVELRQTGIRVIAICPLWVKTEFFDRAVSDTTISNYSRFDDPKDVVIKAIKDAKRGKDISIYRFAVRAQAFFTKLLPHRLIMKIWLKQQGH